MTRPKLVVLVSGAVVLALAAFGLRRSFEEMERDRPELRTRANLRALAQAVEGLCRSSAGCPKTTDALAMALELTSLTPPQKRGLLFDQWEGKILVRVVRDGETTRTILYSAGPNLKDEGGEGDDIVVIVEPSRRQ